MRPIVSLRRLVFAKTHARHPTFHSNANGTGSHGSGSFTTAVCAISVDFVMNLSRSFDRDIPYSPSFILDLPAQVDQNLRNIIDFVFLPGFNNPTLAMLFQTQQTWTGSVFLFRLFDDE